MKSLPSLMVYVAALSGLALAQPPGAAPPPPPPVQVVEVQPAQVPVVFEYNAIVAASKTVEIRSRVQGFIESRDFEEGALVKEGDSLFTIDAENFQADVDVANARVDQAEASLRLAQQEVRRLQSVKEPGAIAKSDVDRRVAEEANANAAVKLAQAELAKAQLELGYTQVKAPINGYMGKALKEIGSYVDAGQNSLLVMMWQVDPIYVGFSMSEREYLQWRGQIERGELVANGTPFIEVTLLNGDVYGAQGELNFESAVVNELTGSVEMRATFPNPDAALKPGQFVKARIVGWQRPNAIEVPQRAISQSPQGATVFVVDAENKAQLRMITPGDWTGSSWVVQKGLQAGDKVIVEGLMKVRPGVQVVPSPWDPNAPPAESEAGAAPADGNGTKH